MDGSDMSTETLRLRKPQAEAKRIHDDNRRPIVTRLWQSYAGDLRDTLEAFDEGLLDQGAVQTETARLAGAV